MLRAKFEYEPSDRSVGIYGGWIGWLTVEEGGVHTQFDFVPEDGVEVGEWTVREVTVYIRKGYTDGSPVYRDVAWQDDPVWEQGHTRERGAYRVPLKLKHIPLAVGAVQMEWGKIQEQERVNEEALEAALARESEDEALIRQAAGDGSE